MEYGNDYDDLSEQEIRDFIQNNFWKFAKTMKHIPHQYCVGETCSDKEMFFRFASHIRKHGYHKNFFKKVYTYFDVDEYQYWTMDDNIEDTEIINRAIKKS